MERIGRYELGPSLRRARTGLGKTLAEVAAEVGTSKSYLSQLERGLIRNPKSSMLERVCLALGIEITFGASTHQDPGAALAYESPILVDGPVATSPVSNQSAVEALKYVLSDSRIPLESRQLLERQVRALVRATQDHVAASGERAMKEETSA